MVIAAINSDYAHFQFNEITYRDLAVIVMLLLYLDFVNRAN